MDPAMIAQIISLLFNLSGAAYQYQVIDKMLPRPPGYYQHYKTKRPHGNGHI